MDRENLELYVFWGPRRESLEACAERLARMLDGLASIHPAFTRWNRKAYTPAAAALPWCTMPAQVSELTQILGEARHYKDFPREATPDLGYSDGAWNSMNGACGISLYFQVGAYTDRLTFPNHLLLTMRARQPGNEDLISAPCLKAVLLSIARAWEASWGNLYTVRSRELLYGNMGHDIPLFRSGWMTYLSAPYAARVKAPARIIRESMPEGGLVMLATDEPYTSENPEHLAGAAAIAKALEPLNERFAKS